MKPIQARPTIWELMECDQGNRWSHVKGGSYAIADGTPCDFSGCPPGHAVHKRGETSDLHEAHDWFRDRRTQAENANV